MVISFYFSSKISDFLFLYIYIYFFIYYYYYYYYFFFFFFFLQFITAIRVIQVKNQTVDRTVQGVSQSQAPAKPWYEEEDKKDNN